MITKLFHNKPFRWLKALIIIVLWVLLTSFLLIYYGLIWHIAFLDSLVHSGLLIGGFILLENIFRYYLPTQGNVILAYIIPLILSIFVLFGGDQLLQTIFKHEIEYQDFLEHIFLARGFVLLLLFMACSLLLNYHGRLEEQAEAVERETQIQQMAREAELYHLRQQLQPHFLFNSLNSISALVKSQPEKAREMVLQLSDFLRATIRKDEKKWISVTEEVSFLKLFLDIEKVRFGHRLQVQIELDDHTKNYNLPQLLIQPLLENAVKHSLYGLTGEVFISLQIVASSQGLIVKITNPFDPRAGQPKGSGFGLEAVKRRLFLVFGRYDLLKTQQTDKQYSIQLLIPQNHDQDYNHR
ncbi:histidine kinase [Marivirga sp. S37H4]|uniref:Histidine kinase n=1 Tax=Marivirga aurantiaca TaxID=2802615 RepID=A0A934WXK7_9BACT|nr:histidine kinase [Marivirga aurantiaca]MBK6264844.1 histidine kinase [Marivirga aurantiaca]